MKFKIFYAPFEGKEEPIDFNVNVNLTDSEINELRELIDPVADLSNGLIPILADKDEELAENDRCELYYKFLDAIFPKIHELGIDLNDCTCEIPQELISKVYLSKDDTAVEINRYLLREQHHLMWSLYDEFASDNNIYDENDFDLFTWEWIEDRLTKIVSERVKEAAPEDLLRDDYNPLSDITADNLNSLYPYPIIETKPVLPECPTLLIDDRFEDAFKTPNFDENGYSESIPAVWGDYKYAEDANGIKIISASYSTMIESSLYNRYLDEEALVWDFGRNRLLLYEPDPERSKLAFKGSCWVYAKKLKPEYSNLSLKDIYLEKVNKM